MASLNNKLACIFLVCMALACVHPARAITCGQVASSLVPCVNYLKRGGPVPQLCCNGIRNLQNGARTVADRRAVCNCMKAAASRAQQINPGNAMALPAKCGVRIPYKISPSTNCASIN